jgi:hypothetical protein
VVAVLAMAFALAGCGSHPPRPAGLRLERTDLVLLARALQKLERPVDGEVVAARAAWPALAGGLPHDVAPSLRLAIATADARAATIALPSLFTVEGALTGPAAGIGGLLKNYALLTQRGWRFLAAASAARERGANTTGSATRPPGSGSAGGDSRAGSSAGGGLAFLLANAGLYVYCVYDGHFELSVLGKKLQSAYAKLGGAAAFGDTLTPATVQALTGVYSPAGVRLAPHPAPGVVV